MLNFDGSWRFDSPGEMPARAVWDFSELIGKIASQVERRQPILEHFKGYFANACGSASSWSTSESWAATDLDNYMRHAAANAPLFIEAFYDAWAALRINNPTLMLPDLARINRVLFEQETGYEIQPPNLVSRNPQVTIAVPERVVSLDEQALALIQRSLTESQRLLAEGRYRPAVQEVLWLLETVSTAFQGLETNSGTVQGKYFNKIAEDLRRHHRGTIFEQVLNWIGTLHGFLSSPTGGGVRHGTDLRAEVSVGPNEALLFCNLIRSYISFLIAEHERLSRGAGQRHPQLFGDRSLG